MLDYSAERSVKVYADQSEEWKVLPWQVRSLFVLLQLHLDPTGRLDCRGRSEWPTVVADLLAMPRAQVKRAGEHLIEAGWLVLENGVLRDPSWEVKQSARPSAAARQQRSRERRRAEAKWGPSPAKESPPESAARGLTLQEQARKFLDDPFGASFAGWGQPETWWPVRQVVEHWEQTFEETLLLSRKNDPRAREIIARIADGHTLEDLTHAITAAGRDEWTKGHPARWELGSLMSPKRVSTLLALYRSQTKTDKRESSSSAEERIDVAPMPADLRRVAD